MGSGSSKIGGGRGGAQQNSKAGDGNLSEALAGMRSGNNGDLPNVINRLDSVLDRMSTGQFMYSETSTEAQISGERTQWRFEKRPDGNFDTTRYERVWTGQTRTGFETHRYDDGVFTQSQVVSQVKGSDPYSVSFYEKGESSTSKYYEDNSRR